MSKSHLTVSPSHKASSHPFIVLFMLFTPLSYSTPHLSGTSFARSRSNASRRSSPFLSISIKRCLSKRHLVPGDWTIRHATFPDGFRIVTPSCDAGKVSQAVSSSI